jgi:hypothetical protein
MTDEERRQYQREYYHKNGERIREYTRNYRKENKAKIDKQPSRRAQFEAKYADYIMKQVEMAEERRGWDV